MDRLLALGVDGIFSNRPDVLRQRVDAAGTGVPAAQRANPVALPEGCPAPGAAAAPVQTPPASSVGAAGGRRLPSTGPTAPVELGGVLLITAALLRRVLYSRQ
jgi:hypothetical protein